MSNLMAPPTPTRWKVSLRKWLGRFPAMTPFAASLYRLARPNEIVLPYYRRSLQADFADWAVERPKLARLVCRFLKVPVPVAQPPAPPLDTQQEISLVETLKGRSADQRSVAFVHHAYYHFFYLAQALRRRGWNAVSICLDWPASGAWNYYHGQDYHIWHEDHAVRTARLFDLLQAIKRNFRMIHWHGESISSVFPENYQPTEADYIPWDFLDLKRQGVKLGHSMSGCLTAQRQSVFNRVSGGVCVKCVWQLRPDVCSEARTSAFNEMLCTLPDLFALEIDMPGDSSRRTRAAFAEPLTYCLDTELWRPDLEPQEGMRLERQPGDILIWHAVGNYSTRDSGNRNIKGTGAVIKAVERLRIEGFPVRLVFRTDVASRDMRFYQVQADIVVDQLNYGRYGASARESMMLGKPTISRMKPLQPHTGKPSVALAECPLIDADETNIYDVLKDLVSHPEKLPEIGRRSREYAVKWHGADACAERFERVYDWVMAGKDVRAFDAF